MARVIDNNVVIKNKLDEQAGIVENGDYQFALSDVLSHEMVHGLQENKYGKIKFNPFHHPPRWKLEDYPEYIARAPLRQAGNYKLKNSIQAFLAATTRTSALQTPN